MVSGAVPSSLRHDPNIVRSLSAAAMGSSVLGAWRGIGCGRQKAWSASCIAAHRRGAILVGSCTSGDGLYRVVQMTLIILGAKSLIGNRTYPCDGPTDIGAFVYAPQ